MIIDYALFDIVEMKKEHPCMNRCSRFQIVRMGADIKIKCLGCGNLIMMPREIFNKNVKKVISHQSTIVEIK